MKESLQEQLARLARSGELPSFSASKPIHQQAQRTASTQAVVHQSSTNAYESLILEIEGLREANIQLVAKLNSVQVNPDAELSQLKALHQEVLDRLQVAQNSNGSLAEENLRLKREIATFPRSDMIQHWQEKAIQADALISEAGDSIKEIQKERLQLAEDRAAFEADLVRIEALDQVAEDLSARQRKLTESEDEIRLRIVAAERSEKKFAVEKARLEKFATELNDLQARVGHLRGIEKALQSLQEEHTKVSRLYEAGKTRIRNLTAEKNQSLQSQSAAEANTKRIIRDLKDALNKLASKPDGEFIIRSFETVRWLVSQFEDPYERLVPKQVLLLGDGPWPIDNFTELLQEIGFEVWQNGCDADIEWAAAGFKDTLLRCEMKLEIFYGNEKEIQPGVQA